MYYLRIFFERGAHYAPPCFLAQSFCLLGLTLSLSFALQHSFVLLSHTLKRKHGIHEQHLYTVHMFVKKGLQTRHRERDIRMYIIYT